MSSNSRSGRDLRASERTAALIISTELRGESFPPADLKRSGAAEAIRPVVGAPEREFLVFGRPLIGEAEIAEVVDSLRGGWVGTGPKVHRFERMLEDYLDVPHVRCVTSGTAALTLGMRVLGIGPGDEVLVPTMAFVASANAVEHVGATPVLVDCDPRTYLIDLEAAERAITPRTGAIMVVHLAGRPLDMDSVNALRDRHSLLVIEDAGHTIGAQWRGAKIGGHGNLTVYSFYTTKNLTIAEGGALVTHDPAVAEQVERLALHGLTLGAWQRLSDAGFRHYECTLPGFKHNMTDLQAALGIHQLLHLDAWIDRRAELWERYDELLAGLPVVCPLPPSSGSRHGRHLCQILLRHEVGVPRDEVLAHLHRRQIGSGVHYRAVHLQPYYRDRYALKSADFPNATMVSDRTLGLPLSPGINEGDQDEVVTALGEAPAWPPRSRRRPCGRTLVSENATLLGRLFRSRGAGTGISTCGGNRDRGARVAPRLRISDVLAGDL